MKYKHTFEDIEGDSPYCNAHHGLRMVEELDGFCVQGKVIGVLGIRDYGCFTDSQYSISFLSF